MRCSQMVRRGIITGCNPFLAEMLPCKTQLNAALSICMHAVYSTQQWARA